MGYSEKYIEYKNQIKSKYAEPGMLAIIAEHKTYVKYIINNQGEMYSRLQFYDKNHETTQIPELGLCINYLKFGLNIPMIDSMCEENLILQNLRNSLLCTILSISADPESRYLYAPTFRAIIQILDFYDIIIRSITPVPAYYHKYRYQRYIEYCLSRPDLFLFPAFTSISATDLLILRPFPIFPVGINITLEEVDEYDQSPIEFFIHDINHTRRMFESNLVDMSKKGLDIGIPDVRLKYYEKSSECLDKILSIMRNTHKTNSGKDVITIKIPTIVPSRVDTIITKKDGLHLNMVDYSLIEQETPIDLGYSQIIKMIIFEITHEDAEPMQEDVICGIILRNSGIEVSFPRISTQADKISVVKNIEKGGSTLGFVKYKLRYGFYDTPDNPMDYVVRHYYRTDNQLAIATQILLKKLCNNPVQNGSPEYDRILINLTDKSGLNIPNHADLVKIYLPEVLKDPKFGDLTDEGVSALRQKYGIPIENSFTGDRPKPVTEQDDLLKKLGGKKYKTRKYKPKKYKTSKYQTRKY